MNREYNIKTIILKKIKQTLQVKLSFEELQYVRDVDGYIDNLTDSIIYRIRYDVASENLEPIKIKYPLSWWEYFKLEWFPKWLIKKYPVLYKEHVINAKVFYPKISLKNEESYIKYSYQENK